MTTEQTNDATSLLVRLCVKVLKASANGMTTKEMAAALDNEITDGFEGISSSILSSKLNAVFRRCRNISRDARVESLAELPLSRAQSAELPKRLVYRYTNDVSDSTDKKAQQHAESDAAKTTHKPDVSESVDTEVDAETRTSATANNSSEDEADTDNTRAPLTPKEEHTENTWPAAKRQRRNTGSFKEMKDEASGIPRSSTPPNIENATSSRKALTTSRIPKFNLYYDFVGLEAVSAALDCGDMANSVSLAPGQPSAEDVEADHYFEYISPESLPLNELDQLIN